MSVRDKTVNKKRKAVLQKGATIRSERWIKYPGEKKFYEVNIFCNGWNIHAPGMTKLEAFKGALFCVDCALEEQGPAIE